MTVETDPVGELARAKSDYLAVSRGAHLYASAEEHRRAEERAWERLAAAQAQVAEVVTR